MSRLGKLAIAAVVLSFAGIGAWQDPKVKDAIAASVLKVAIAVGADAYKEKLVTDSDTFKSLLASRVKCGNDYDRLEDGFKRYEKTSIAYIQKLEADIAKKEALLKTVKSDAYDAELKLLNDNKRLELEVVRLRVSSRDDRRMLTAERDARAAEKAAFAEKEKQLQYDKLVRELQIESLRVYIREDTARKKKDEARRSTEVAGWMQRDNEHTLRIAESRDSIAKLQLTNSELVEVVETLAKKNKQLVGALMACQKQAYRPLRRAKKALRPRMLRAGPQRVPKPCFFVEVSKLFQ